MEPNDNTNQKTKAERLNASIDGQIGALSLLAIMVCAFVFFVILSFLVSLAEKENINLAMDRSEYTVDEVIP